MAVAVFRFVDSNELSGVKDASHIYSVKHSMRELNSQLNQNRTKPGVIAWLAASVALLCLPVTLAFGDCPADLDGSGEVGGSDIGLLLAQWGPGSGSADLNEDGLVSGADLGAMLGLAKQTRTPSIMIAQLVGMSMERLAFTVVLDSIAAFPGNIDDPSLVALADLIRGLDDQRLRLVVADERRFFLDIAQRVYTDDGQGGGSLSLGSPVVEMLGVPSEDLRPEFFDTGAGEFLLGPLVAELTIGRADAVRLWMNTMDAVEEQASRPPWEIDLATLGLIDEIPRESMKDDLMLRIRYFPITLIIPATEGLVFAGAAVRMERDLVLTVLELEATRRRNGVWPHSLDELKFAAGGELARDPFDGSTVRYQYRDGRPLLYILGPDRDDDEGRGMSPSGSESTDP